jgi:hypothetical protein
MAVIELRDDVRANHFRVSEEWARFLTYAGFEGGYLQQAQLLQDDLNSIVRNYQYALNTWPIFISPETRSDFAECAVQIPLLVPRIMRAVFALDADAIALYYDVSIEFAEAIAKHLPDYDIPAHLITRTDAILTADGVRSLEINSGSNTGGWQIQLLDGQYRKQNFVREFIQSMERCESHNTLLELYRHLVASCRARFPGRSCFTWVLVVEDAMIRDGHDAGLRQVLLHFATNDGLDLDLVFVKDMADMQVNDGYLWLGERCVNVLMLGRFAVQLPPNLFGVALQDNLVWPDNPFCGLLNDKRNMALLYQHRDCDEFSAAEQALIERYIPWSAPTSQERVVFEGSEWALGELLLVRQSDFVLKPARGARGDDVFVGCRVERDTWIRAVTVALESGRFVAQIFCKAIPFYAHHELKGCCIMDFVWGIFSFGHNYGGAWVRMMPTMDNKEGVVNSARGAQESIVYEAAR